MKSRITAVFVFVLLSGLTVAPTLITAATNQTPSEPEKKEVTRVRMGGKIMAAMIVHKVQPEYPAEARKERIQGTVRLHIIIGTTGKVQQLEVMSCPDLLQRSAVDAVRQWEYRPTYLNHKSVEVDTVVDAIYSLSS